MKVLQVKRSARGLETALSEGVRPLPGPGQVLVEVHAAGVTPTELGWYPTTHTPSGEERLDAVPGHEFSGVVAGLGAGVSEFAVGQEVYGMNDWFQDGAMAEYCIAMAWGMARKPRGLSHAEAATVPIGALTARQGLYEKAMLRAGERVLVLGGAGAVGLFAVQMARLEGASVVATTSLSTVAAVRALGAVAVAYESLGRDEIAGAFDVIFDTVGGEARERARAALKPGGRMISIAAEEEGNGEAKVRDGFFIVEPRGEELAEIGRLMDAGALRTFVKGVTTLAQAGDVYREAGRIHGPGKFVVEIARG